MKDYNVTYGVSFDGTKLMCCRCNEEKPFNQFPIDRSRTRGYLSYCKACAKKRRAERKDITRNQERNSRLKRLYGMTIESFNELMEKQNNSCAICFNPFPKDWSASFENYALDHCHETMITRGILCKRCNLLLGYAEDSIKTLQSAIEYLKKFQ